MIEKSIFDRIISFLFGASWAILVLGALIVFRYTISWGLALSLFLTLLFIIFSLFLILALDAFSVNRKRFEEAKKQTEFMEKISSKFTK